MVSGEGDSGEHRPPNDDKRPVPKPDTFTVAAEDAKIHVVGHTIESPGNRAHVVVVEVSAMGVSDRLAVEVHLGTELTRDLAQRLGLERAVDPAVVMFGHVMPAAHRADRLLVVTQGLFVTIEIDGEPQAVHRYTEDWARGIADQGSAVVAVIAAGVLEEDAEINSAVEGGYVHFGVAPVVRR